MKKHSSHLKKVLRSGMFCLVFLPSMAPAAQWVIRFPANEELKYQRCEIIASTKSGHSGRGLINKGETWRWTAPDNIPITVVSARCQPDGWGSYFTEIQGRACDGTDFETAVSGHIACAGTVQFKICPKTKDGSIGRYSHGFCAD